MSRDPQMDLRELRDCIDSSFGPGPTQNSGLTAHLIAFSWPGGADDRSAERRRDRRFWAEQAVLPLPTCTCDSGRCRLCN